MNDEKTNSEYSELAKKVLELAGESIIVKFRYFDTALTRIKLIEDGGIKGFETRMSDSGVELAYNPYNLLICYKEDEAYAVRMLMHVILHNVFLHYYRKDIVNEEYWNIATDIAVENVIFAMDVRELGMELKRDSAERETLARLGKWIPRLTAEKIYREFMVGGISEDGKDEYARNFSFDIHPSEKKADIDMKENVIISRKEFEQIARKLSQELKSFSKDVKGKGEILLNLNEGTRIRYDYDEILRIFSCNTEEIKVNPDEFDYIYYTYGLREYGNVPLIEPLEYTDEKKIKEFVIAIDTSASVRGDVVEGFLRRTYDILENSVSFSENLLVHIIQCDSDITDDKVIKSVSELKKAAGSLKVKGFGATDFRPVFKYVDELIDRKEFTNLRGLIYFTDGYGIYPEKPTKYDTMFVFNNHDEYRMQPPGWAVSVELN